MFIKGRLRRWATRQLSISNFEINKGLQTSAAAILVTIHGFLLALTFQWQRRFLPLTTFHGKFWKDEASSLSD